MSRVLQGVSAAHSSTAKVRTRPHTRAHTLSSGRAKSAGTSAPGRPRCAGSRPSPAGRASPSSCPGSPRPGTSRRAPRGVFKLDGGEEVSKRLGWWSGYSIISHLVSSEGHRWNRSFIAGLYGPSPPDQNRRRRGRALKHPHRPRNDPSPRTKAPGQGPPRATLADGAEMVRVMAGPLAPIATGLTSEAARPTRERCEPLSASSPTCARASRDPRECRRTRNLPGVC